MSIRLRRQFDTGRSLAYSIERLSDGSFWDFTPSGGTGQTFTTSPAIPLRTFPEDSGNFLGRYKDILSSTPGGQFTDGAYAIMLHDTANSNLVVDGFEVVMHGGDDAPVFPVAGAGDPWAVVLPGSYGAGTAGFEVGHFTGGADPWATLLPAAYGPGTAGKIVGTNLDALISSRVATGGSVVLASNGLDGVQIETGTNARQALEGLFAAMCGCVFVTGSVAPFTTTIHAGGLGPAGAVRIISSDTATSRTVTTLNLP